MGAAFFYRTVFGRQHRRHTARSRRPRPATSRGPLSSSLAGATFFYRPGRAATPRASASPRQAVRCSTNILRPGGSSAARRLGGLRWVVAPKQKLFCNIRLQTKTEADQVIDGKAHEKEAHLARVETTLLVLDLEYPVEVRSGPKCLVSRSSPRSTRSPCRPGRQAGTGRPSP